MGGAPRNPAPRNHLLVRIVKPSGCHCTDGHLTSSVFTEDQTNIAECRPPLGALPLSSIPCGPPFGSPWTFTNNNILLQSHCSESCQYQTLLLNKVMRISVCNPCAALCLGHPSGEDVPRAALHLHARRSRRARTCAVSCE